MALSTSLGFLPKLLLQHDASPDSVLEDVASAFVAAAQQRHVHASMRPAGDGLAVALGQRLVVLHGLGDAASTSGSGDRTASGGRSSRRGSGAAAGATAIEFVSAVDAPETITALCWLAGSGQSADECLLVGTSGGHLQLHSATSGALLLRQQLHHTAAVAAAVRWGGSGTDPEDLSEDVTITFADATVRLPAWEVWAAVRWHAGQAGRSGGSHWWSAASAAATAAAGGGSAPHHLAFSKFTLPRGTGPRSAALCLGPPPPSLYAAMTGRREGQHRLHILTVGSAPPVAAYEVEESRAPGLLSLVSDLASSTAASLLGKARWYVPNPAAAAGRSLLGGLRRQRSGGGSAGSVASSASSSMADLQAAGAAGAAGQQQGRRRGDKIPGEPASLAAAVWDEKRAVTQMAPSPCGRWAACCDSLGRVLLVDATSTLILRMLKGYRDAQVAWLVCPEGSGASGSASAAQGGWAARRLHGGSSSSLGGSSAAGSLSVRSSAADLAALQPDQQPQVEWEEGWGMDDASQQQSDEHASDPGEPAEQQPLAQQQRQQQQQQQPDAPGGSPERQQPPPAMRFPAQQSAAADAPRPTARPRSPLLVVYAPRRAVVELWEPHILSRLGSVACSTQLGLLLAQPVRRQHGSAGGSRAGAPPPNRCMLLDACTLTLTDLTDVLLSSAL
ncbi:Rab3 GTPase-activating non-catalytic subunit [Chlorella sorokiniana]|uniref:Rab3 GTPase-activating non-catalytic subunit n=1 Tax=Chlorella sorokiniana TaxID=3076 RepID=A0A2P6TU43_CHLSO|nr:Rab3 GTPase-activating non-catalytic subunit [Chlorella sorokiniana]|eukprot:PRW57579.1 Rab3 GTPase-activating non-catalytic subunit [Chlorella sorokiniana]